jgi:hypothetical protein
VRLWGHERGMDAPVRDAAFSHIEIQKRGVERPTLMRLCSNAQNALRCRNSKRDTCHARNRHDFGGVRPNYSTDPKGCVRVPIREGVVTAEPLTSRDTNPWSPFQAPYELERCNGVPNSCYKVLRTGGRERGDDKRSCAGTSLKQCTLRSSYALWMRDTVCTDPT